MATPVTTQTKAVSYAQSKTGGTSVADATKLSEARARARKRKRAARKRKRPITQRESYAGTPPGKDIRRGDKPPGVPF